MLERIHPLLGPALPPGQCIIDIETAGLVRQRDPIFIMGFIYRQGENNLFHQLAIDRTSADEEGIMLEKAIAIMENKQLISFNGDSFDLPYILARISYWKLPEPELQSLDLYAWIRRRKKFFGFPRLKLKELEKEAGIDREDELSGKEVAEAFDKVDRDKDLLEKTLGHNREDVINTGKLLNYFDQLEDQLSLNLTWQSMNFRAVLENYRRIKDYSYLDYITGPETPLGLQLDENFGSISWQDKRLIFRFPCHLVEEKDADSGELDVAVLVGPGEDLSPYRLPPPLIVLSDGRRHFTDNLHKQAEAIYRRAMKLLQ